jgi:hypothetical protein
MSLKGLTTRSQRQAAYGLIPDSFPFYWSSISQLSLLEPGFHSCLYSTYAICYSTELATPELGYSSIKEPES